MSSYFLTYGGNRLTFPGEAGAIAWEAPEEGNVLVMLDPDRESNLDYLKMRFVSPGGTEIVLEDGDGNTASASAYVPTNSTAYWTAHGYEGDTTAKYFVSALACSGFSGVSADTAVTTAVIESPYATAYGSALLTATDSASASSKTWTARRVVYGLANTGCSNAITATPFFGTYSSTMESTRRTAWIPNGTNILWSARSPEGFTFSVNGVTGLSNFNMLWSHYGSGSLASSTGRVDTSIALSPINIRTKRVYASGFNPAAPATAYASACQWQPYSIISSFSSNLCSGSSKEEYLNGSGVASSVYGFITFKNNQIGVCKDTAGSFTTVTSSTDTFKWRNSYLLSNSAYASAIFSAYKAVNGTTAGKASARFMGCKSGGSNITLSSSLFSLPTTAAARTVTTTATCSSSTDSAGVSLCTALVVDVPASPTLRAQCSGVWTASGVVM